MNWLNLRTETLHAPNYIGSDPTRRATWLSLMLWCAQQENGGIIAGWAFNKYYRISLPPYLGFFAGKRFVPIVTAFAAIALGLAVWLRRRRSSRTTA